MIALLLVLVPLIAGLATFFIKEDGAARGWSAFAAVVVLFIALAGWALYPGLWNFDTACMGVLGSSFSLNGDGMGKMLCLLTAIAFPLIFAATAKTKYRNGHNFFGLMLLAEAGLMGVFLAKDALLFYFFWELALIPVYFICSQWGNERRIPVTFKFFIYTFIGSLLMLVGILYIYTKAGSFDMDAFYKAGQSLSYKEQSWVFWLFFIAFGIKMPIFPLHSWQPDTYEQSPTAGTMVLSGLMVKMGVLGLLRWLLPVLPIASYSWGDTVSWLAVIGIVYASFIAFQQDDMKRLVAYSSIAHMGLMRVAVFSEDKSAVQGAMLQMFTHGINIIGMWVVVEIIERKFGTRKMSELGGISQKAPVLAIFFFIIAFANIALPLTSGFIGEFLMFNGIFSSTVTKYNIAYVAVAGLGIIMGAVYTLMMARKVFFGETSALTARATDIGANEKVVLGIIVMLIIIIGIYPAPLLNSLGEATDTLLKTADVQHLLKK